MRNQLRSDGALDIFNLIYYLYRKMKTKNTIRGFRALFIGLVAFTVSAPFIASAEVIQSFTAVSHGQEVYLQWATTQETGLAAFRIQRSFDGRYFHNLHTVTPTGSNSSYSYIDDDLFKSNLQTFYYRIEIASANRRVDYSLTERVELAFSGIRKTWGSIKAMFR